jgi:hypothetical protein
MSNKDYQPADFEEDAEAFENAVPDDIFPPKMLEPMRNFIRRLVVAHLQDKPIRDEDKQVFINNLVREMTALTATFVADANRAEAVYLQIKAHRTAGEAQRAYDQFVTSARANAKVKMQTAGVVDAISELTARLHPDQQSAFIDAVIANAQNLSFQQSGIAERHPCLDMESHAADILQQLKGAILAASSGAVDVVNEVRAPLAAIILGAVAVPLMGPMALVPVLGFYATSEAGDRLAVKGVIPPYWRSEAALGVKNILFGTCEMLSEACGGLAAGAKNTTVLSKNALLSLMTNASDTARAVVSDVRNAVDFANICREWTMNNGSSPSSSQSSEAFSIDSNLDVVPSRRILKARQSISPPGSPRPVFENMPSMSASQESNSSFKTVRSGMSSVSTIANLMIDKLEDINQGAVNILNDVIRIDMDNSAKESAIEAIEQQDPEFFAKYPILSDIDYGGRRRRGRKSRRHKKKRSTLKRRGLKRRRTRKGKKRRHTKKRR